MVSTRTPRGGVSGGGDRLGDLPRRPAHVLALDVRGHGQVALRHVAVDLAGPHAPADRRHVADHQVDQGVDRLERQGLDVFRLLDPQGRDLNLDQVVEARLHVDPVVERGEAGRRRRHDDGMSHVLDLDAAEPRLLAIDVDLDGRVVELLLELDVAEEGDALHVGGDLLRVLPHHLQVGADDPDRDRRRRAEAHDLGHDVARLEAEGRHLGLPLRLRLGQSPLLQPLGQPRDHPLGQDLAQPLAELVELDAAVLAERDAQLAVVGPAHEQHHVVDAEVRGDLADVAHRDRDVLGLRLALDLLEALDRHLPGQLEVRAGRRPEPEHEFARIDLRKQLGADLQAQHPEDQAARRRGRPARPASAAGRTSPPPCRRP